MLACLPLTTEDAIAGPPFLLTELLMDDMLPSGPRLVITVLSSPAAIPAATPPLLGSTSIMPMAGPGPAAVSMEPSDVNMGAMRVMGGIWLVASADSAAGQKQGRQWQASGNNSDSYAPRLMGAT
jgi:hypothetical protein